jgi:hypothetical protein
VIEGFQVMGMGCGVHIWQFSNLRQAPVVTWMSSCFTWQASSDVLELTDSSDQLQVSEILFGKKRISSLYVGLREIPNQVLDEYADAFKQILSRLTRYTLIWQQR